MKKCTESVFLLNVGVVFSSFMPSVNGHFHAREPFVLGGKNYSMWGFFFVCLKTFVVGLGSSTFYTCSELLEMKYYTIYGTYSAHMHVFCPYLKYNFWCTSG